MCGARRAHHAELTFTVYRTLCECRRGNAKPVIASAVKQYRTGLQYQWMLRRYAPRNDEGERLRLLRRRLVIQLGQRRADDGDGQRQRHHQQHAEGVDGGQPEHRAEDVVILRGQPVALADGLSGGILRR